MTNRKNGRTPLSKAELTAATRARRRVREGEARMIRTEAGVSLPELAAMLNVSASTVGRWERGDVQVPLRLAAEYMDIIDRLEWSEP